MQLSSAALMAVDLTYGGGGLQSNVLSLEIRVLINVKSDTLSRTIWRYICLRCHCGCDWLMDIILWSLFHIDGKAFDIKREINNKNVLKDVYGFRQTDTGSGCIFISLHVSLL